ncbi:TonB-dependent receptor plug domain-containing protein [Pseudoduganella sp. RAF19]|uniref:TonB-dependent receptor plug domain-containing protein n=1 Tax=Pseudoduganella sp. RAF19 TaxID=3233052 RepID=UPI003F9C18CD
MRPALLIVPLLTTALAANAEEDIARVEIKADSGLQLRRQDMAGRIVVSRDELTRYGDASVADALRRQPGIVINGSKVQLRGLGGGRTQFLINGDPAPPGFSPDSLAPELIERVEILRSASADSSTQGIAGSINIVLRKSAARAQTLATLAGTHGSAGWSPEAALDLSRPGDIMSGTLAARATRSHRSTSNTTTEINPDASRVTSDAEGGTIDRLGLTPRLNWKWKDGATLSWQSLLDIANSDNHDKAQETILAGASSDYPHNGFASSAHTVTARSDVEGGQRLGENGRFEWKAGLAHSRRNSDYRFIGSSAADEELWQRHVLSNAIDDGASSSGKLRIGGDSGHAMSVGWDGTLARRSEWRRQEDADATGIPLGVLDQRYVARVSRLAMYAQDEWSPLPQLDVYIGLRWEGLRTRTTGRDIDAVANHSSVWSPVAHLLWRLPGKRDQFRLALARSYKAPATRDLVPRRYTVNNDNGPTNPHYQGNPDLRPELAWGADLAYESYFKGDSMVSVSAYQRRISDVILPWLFQDRGEWVNTPRNSGRAVTNGIEMDGRLSFGASGATARLTVSRNWSRVDSVPGPDNRLGEQTPLVVNAGLDYRLSAATTAGFNWNIKTGGIARTSATQWSERGIERRLDLRASWQLKPGVTLKFAANNVLAPDARSAQRYDDGSSNYWRGIASSSERTIRIAAECAL